MTDHEAIRALLEQIAAEVVDVRQPPDQYRSGQFKAGWRAQADGAEYSDRVLSRLTWKNLGYRLSEAAVVGENDSDERLEELFEVAAQGYSEGTLRLKAPGAGDGPGVDGEARAKDLSAIDREAILGAAAEYDELGRDRFLTTYGYGPSKLYYLAHDGRRYESKAIVGVAHGYVPGLRPLLPSDFSGGQEVKRVLEREGFEVLVDEEQDPWPSAAGRFTDASPESSRRAAEALLRRVEGVAVAGPGGDWQVVSVDHATRTVVLEGPDGRVEASAADVSAAAASPDAEQGPQPAPVEVLALAGASDRPITATARAEQRQLRARLLSGSDHGWCALCGQRFPSRFLVAAHIKRRGACDEHERRQSHVVMLACSFGCDQLYEDGFVTVDETGNVIAGLDLDSLDGPPAKYAELLIGRTCSAHTSDTEPFFAWHRTHPAGL